jgi:hypothetical protein
MDSSSGAVTGEPLPLMWMEFYSVGRLVVEWEPSTVYSISQENSVVA